jgi:hypothetical protein
MWATLAFVTALSLAPNQAGQLKLTNDRATYGYLGATRPDNKLYPGDIYFITFDIDNLDVGADGEIRYSMGMDLLNSKGKSEYSREPQEVQARNDLGGKAMPGYAAAEVGTETAPGEYTMKVTVTDLRAKQTRVLERKFEVLPKDFALVRTHLAYFAQAPVPAPPLFVAGQAIFFNCSAVGFSRDKNNKDQPNVGIEMVIRDENGKPTLSKPVTDEVTMLPENVKNLAALPIGIPVQLNRPGKFTLELQATDRVSKKTAKVTLPITVVEQKEK